MDAKKTLLLLGVVVILISSGCESIIKRKAASVVLGEKGSILIIKLVGKDPVGYNNVFIGDVTSALGDALPPEIIPSTRSNLMSQISTNKKLTHKAYLLEDAPKSAPGLIISSEILDYEPGSQLQRAATVGGEAFIIIRYTVKDASTGEVLAILNSRGFVSGGLTGGTMDEAITKANKAVIYYLTNALDSVRKDLDNILPFG